jgi:dipeptidyl aminopeptidase/acylaminoacyl peptidase
MIRKLIVSRIASGVCALVVCFGSGALGAQSFTIQQAMSAPFNSELRASPKGVRFLWIANQEGRRNIWVADAEKEPIAVRQVTQYDADDGLEIGEVSWTPDGESIVYVRGGDFEHPARPLPNPALLPGGVGQDMWIVAAAGGQPRKIAEGRAPSVSPDGKTLAFLSKEQIWTVALGDASARPVQMFHARGAIGEPMWSPDGKSLAFTSGRLDHSFIGVYSLERQSIAYMDPSTEMDLDPTWSPDSKQVVFVRIPPDTSTIDFKPHRAAEPWSLRVADAATGKGREIWRATRGQGSVFHPDGSERQLLWTAGGLIVFPWEADGWLHLYSVSAKGGTPLPLTPGEFEVEHVALSPDRASVVFSSNQDDIDRRHVWQVSPDAASQGLRRLTKGDGIEVFPVVAANGTVAVLRSDARVPIRPAIVAANGEMKDLAPQLIPKDFPAAKMVVPQQVIFAAADGMKIHGQLFVPPNLADGKKHPALVFFHGGSRRQMLLGFHYMGYYSNAYAMNQYLASLGYIVLSANYRSGIGYGLNFREALDYGADGASEFNDVQGAGLYLRSRKDVDPARIGTWGGSYGGYLVALALARSSDLFAAGVDFHGVHDWNLTTRNYQASFDPADDPTAARRAWESSPLSSVKNWKSPVLLIQGDDDRNVQFANTVRLAAALRVQGVEFEEHVFPDEIHTFLLHRNWLESYELTADFLNRHLK